MTRPELLRKLDALFEKAEKEQTFGCVEIELRAGKVTLIRKTDTERVEDNYRETTQHAARSHR